VPARSRTNSANEGHALLADARRAFRPSALERRRFDRNPRASRPLNPIGDLEVEDRRCATAKQ
jgi:hypothetical protein